MGGFFSRWKASETDPPSDEEEKEDDAVLTRSLGFAWVTLATNDSYCLGALVLAHSLRNAGTAHKLAVLITPGVSPPMKEQLSTVFDVVKLVDVLDSKDEAHLALMKRPELGVTFTKIHCWRLTEFEKCVFLDADTLVIKNCDELFDREELSAAPDVGWPDCFNTGVFVYKPSIETFDNLIKFSLESGSFDGGDQGLLNKFFGEWATKDIDKHLPFVYNLTSVAVYSYIPAFKQYGSEVRIVHFIGAEKPWLQQLDPQTRSVCTGPGREHFAPMLQLWWNIYCDKVHPSMTSNLEYNSGMRDDEIEACVNDNPIEPEPEPEVVQPFTPYLDKDDSRQINLPYQNFDVKSSTGELLNITYLEKREQEIKEEERKENTEQQEEVQEEWKPDNDCGLQLEKLTERFEEILNDRQMEENQPKERPKDYPVEEHPSLEEPPEEPQVEPSPFNHENYFPDETCVQEYLQQNVMTYQPLQQHEKKVNIVNTIEEEHHLPRFLAIAEDDKRQSLNVYCREGQKQFHTPPENLNSNNSANENQSQSFSEVESLQNDLPETSPEPIKPKWKSLSHLGNSPPEKSLEKTSFWKSHPNLNDPNRRYSMPKLKPILPKQSISQVCVSDVRPKVTQYTEFHMSCDYPDEAPCDKIGFIERHIFEEVAHRVPYAETEMLKTLSCIFPLGAPVNTKEVSKPPGTDDVQDESDCDLSSCQRQKGNQPLHNATKKRSNSCFLPVLKPIRPSKNEELKKMVRASNRSTKERGTKAKIQSRKAREKAKVELNVKPSANTSSVEDILKKLISFSKDYQGYFTECPVNKNKETLLGPAFKNVYAASAKDSPRIQYSKDFEDPLDLTLPQFVNGHSSSTKEDTAEMEQTYVVNGYTEEPVHKRRASVFCDVPQPFNGETNGNNGTLTFADVANEPESGRIVQTFEIPPNLSKDETGKVNGNDPEVVPNGCETNGLSTGAGIVELMRSAARTVETNGTNLFERQRDETPPQEKLGLSYASVVRHGDKTFRTNPSTSINTQPKEKKSAKRSRPSRASRKKEKELPRTSNQRVPVAPPPLPRPYSPPEEVKPVGKPINLFTLLPEESLHCPATKAAKRKPKPVTSQPSQRRPARKTNQDRHVVESLPTVDGGLVDNSGIAGAIARLSIQPGGPLGAPSEAIPSAQEDCIRRQNWEMGTMDYMGRDSFDNIWSKICETIDGKATKDLNPDGASIAPSADAATPQKDDVAPEKIQIQSQESPKKMTEQSQVVPPGQTDTSAGNGKIGSEITAKASEIASKATEALEAFGKLFVSGPVAIKSEVTEGAQKSPEVEAPTEKKEEPQAEKEASAERKQSVELDEEGKPKKGVINKILELVGVAKPDTSTAVFYDKEQPESEKPKEDRGKSVFYDTETPQSDSTIKEEPKLSAAEAEGTSKVRAPSPSLTLKTTLETEVVCPTPPSTPMTPQIGLKDGKMLTVDDTIKATPPVTDKKFDAVPQVSHKDSIKSEVDNIIDEAKKLAETQLQESKAEQQPSTPVTSMALVPRLNDALEVFGKLFVSGPVTIKSEIPEEVQKTPETPKLEIETKKADDTPKPAIPMPDVPAKMSESTPPVAPETEAAPAATESAAAYSSTESEKSKTITPQPPESVTSETLQPSEPAGAEKPKAEEPKVAETPKASEPAGAETPKAEEPKVAETPKASEPAGAETPKAEEPKVAETPKASEPAGAETPKAEEPKATETPKASEPAGAETPKAEEPKAAETPKASEPAGAETPKAEEPKVAETPKASDPAGTEVKKSEEPPTPNIAELASAAVEVVAASLTKAAEPTALAGTPSTYSTPATTQPPPPTTPQVTDTPAPSTQPETPQPAEPAPANVQVPQSQVPTAPQEPSALAPATPKTEILPVPTTDSPKPSEPEPAAVQQSSEKTNEPGKVAENAKTESAESPLTTDAQSKANEALEAFGKHFVSGPVVIKSEESEPAKPASASEKPESEPAAAPAKVPEPSGEHSKTSEALEAFGRSFISGPVAVKSEPPEGIVAPGEAETDAVHRVFQPKPDEEPVYSNIGEVEEIRVTSEEDRRKEKPQSSKLTEQILKAIPPEMRKPFSETDAEASPEVAQLLSAAEQRTAHIPLDKPTAEEDTSGIEGGESGGPSTPPVPPRRNRSKGRDAPQPPPKKKGKNGKD